MEGDPVTHYGDDEMKKEVAVSESEKFLIADERQEEE